MRTHVDLFSGIGGFTLAAARNGVRTVQMCEIDPRCRDFLARAWPGVPIHDDVRTLGLADATQVRERPGGSRQVGCEQGADSTYGSEGIWILTAGVPCQPASRAGKQRGAADDRWLWPEALRLLRHFHPTWALFENPAGIGDVGLAGILAQVEAEGYEVRVHSIPACAVGAPHRRERYWIVAHADQDGSGGGGRRGEAIPDSNAESLGHAAGERGEARIGGEQPGRLHRLRLRKSASDAITPTAMSTMA